MYRDRPLSPMKTVKYWIEYVIRYQGAPHMKSPAKDMNYFQRNSMDVLAFFCLIISLVLLTIMYLYKGLVKVAKQALMLISPTTMGQAKRMRKKKAQ